MSSIDDDKIEEGLLNEENINISEEISDDSTEHSSYKVPSAKDATIKYHLTGMYQSWFLDYASYVILERAVPDIFDGLKPVQRRILHSMKRLDDGRYNKVANIVGHTMQFHPHGDASIGDALVQLGQKDLLIDTQGNWGNILTGDGAAAPRYIEARLTKFALETVFNPKTTHWKLSYDGRNKEPINLPVKFPLLLAQGVEGIAVGLNSKILPHNFNELCQAAIAYLRQEEFVLYPDFQTGGSIDVSRYNDGERGGAVKIRSKITKLDNKTLVITEIPYGSNTSKVIESIIRANEKGKIKIRKVDDNTSANVEILVHLQAGSSSDKTIDALYAFTDCEQSISPNCCVICEKKPIFTTVSEMLRISVNNTKNLLKQELEIQKDELREQLFFISLEKIFIEERIYKDKNFEDSTSQDAVIEHIDKRLEPFKPSFIREVRVEDIQKLLEIKMMRITKFDSEKANDLLLSIQAKIDEINKHLSNLIEYTISWFENLQKKYGKDYPRRTELRNFETIVATKVIEANQKLYINREEGFIGTGLKKDEFVCNCSEIDDVILFFKDGKYKIVKVSEKQFVGTNILHLDVFKKNDTRTIYNAVYRDGKAGPYYMKRFAVTGIAREKEYDLTKGVKGSKVIYFTANPNGEAEIIRVVLRPNPKIKKLSFESDLSALAIKGRQSQGNLLTKNDVHKITLKQKGGSTLGGRKVWFDPDVLRLNYDARGNYLGEFQGDDLVLVINTNGNYYTTSFDLNNHFHDIYKVEKFDADKTWSVALWDADQKFYYLKRFPLEVSTKPLNFLGDNADSKFIVVSDAEQPIFNVKFGGGDNWREALDVDVAEFIGVKSYKAKGKRLTAFEVASITDITPTPIVQEIEEVGDDVSVAKDVEFEEVEPTRLEEIEMAANPIVEANGSIESSSAVKEDFEDPHEGEATTPDLAPKAKDSVAIVESMETTKDKAETIELTQKEASDLILEIVAEIPEESLPAPKLKSRGRKPRAKKDDIEQMNLF